MLLFLGETDARQGFHPCSTVVDAAVTLPTTEHRDGVRPPEVAHLLLVFALADHVSHLLQLRWAQGFLVPIVFDNCYPIAHIL